MEGDESVFTLLTGETGRPPCWRAMKEERGERREENPLPTPANTTSPPTSSHHSASQGKEKMSEKKNLITLNLH